MFGLGIGEIVIILVLALILLGPAKLPSAAKQLGKGLRELRKASDELKQQFEHEMHAIDQAASLKPSAPKPTLVQPGAAPGSAAPAPALAGDAAPPAPAATADNVPGLEAAVAEPPPPPAPPPPDTVTRIS